MFEIKEKPRQVEKALLVGVYSEPAQQADARSLLDELASLVETLGLQILDRLLVRVPEPSSRWFVGSGKAEEIAARAQELGADVIVFDNELQPAQQRNWEALAKVAVIDRQEVILDIFAGRAQTKEARLQVDLARLEYSLPRLTAPGATLAGRQAASAEKAKVRASWKPTAGWCGGRSIV
jgi:GTP-binding protein HflX